MIKHWYPPILIIVAIFMSSTSLISQEGVLTVNGNLSLPASALYELELKDLTGAGTGHDQIIVAGDLSLAATLDIVLNGYSPDINDDFEIIAFSGNLSGTFGNINWPSSMVSQGWAIDYGVINPGKVTIYGPQSPLPIELSSFTVEKVGFSHLLQWETLSEYDNDYFVVEHSLDIINFTTLGIVKGYGNSSTKNKYNYSSLPSSTDRIHYYRLKQVDYDGQYTLSSIIAFRDDFGEELIMYPSPSNGMIYFNSIVEGIVVYDINGREVYRSKISAESYDLTYFSKGLYHIQILGNQSSKLLLIK